MAACALGLMSAAALVTGSQTGVAPRVSDLAAAGQDGAVAPSPVNDAQSQRYGKLPLSFVPNRGQTSKPVRYYAHGPRFSLYLTKHKAVLALANGRKGVALHLRFLGANPSPSVQASERRSGKVNYLNRSGGRYTGLPTYGRIVYRDLWPGIDMAFRGPAGALEYEFVVHPGADVGDIRLAYEGAQGLTVGRAGRLSIRTALGNLSEAAPRSYQRIGGRRVPVASRFSLTGKRRGYGFTLGRYDPRYPLVIDPYLAYSTYLGGNDREEGQGIAVDASGNAYVTGGTWSPDFPTTPGAFDTTLATGGVGDVFVTKLNPSGSGLVYSTFIDGGYGEDIAVDSQGHAYVTGTAGGALTVTPGAYDTTYNGAIDDFVAELSASGDSLLYSTFLGGTREEARVYDDPQLAIDAAGNAYVAGHTNSADFPTTPGAFDTTLDSTPTYLGGDAFVTKLNPSGSGLVYSTFVGGGGREDQRTDVAVGSDGSAYVTGGTASFDFPVTPGAYDTTFNGTANFNAYVTKLNPAGSGLTYSTLLGSSTDGHSIAIDPSGSAYVIGETSSATFPVTPGASDTDLSGTRDVYVSKLNAAGSALLYSTYLGGASPDDEYPLGVGVDDDGAAWVVGGTRSANFPTTPDAVDRFLSGTEDGFVTKLNPAGSALLYSSFLGGSNYDAAGAVALDSDRNAYTTGSTTDIYFPTTPGAYDTTYNDIGYGDAFVTKIAGTQRSSPRPVGASPLEVSFVPAYRPCETNNADSQHGPPLGFASCSNPTPLSSTVRMGSNAISIVRVVVCTPNSASAFCNPAGSLPKPDVRFTGSIRDVRCASTVPAGCLPGGDYEPDPGPGPYTDAGNGKAGAQPPCFPSGTSTTDCVAGADLTEMARLPGSGVGGVGTQFEGKGVRITDSASGSPSLEATMTDIGFPVPLDCIPTTDASQGSACGVNTTANALVPGVVQSGKAAVWRFGELQLVDSGPDGVRGNSDDELFAVQGIFLP